MEKHDLSSLKDIYSDPKKVIHILCFLNYKRKFIAYKNFMKIKSDSYKELYINHSRCTISVSSLSPVVVLTLSVSLTLVPGIDA